MCKPISFFKKFTLAILVLTVGLVAIPASGAFAAGFQDQITPLANQALSNVRLEQTWAGAQAAYQIQGDRLAKADTFISKVQTLIEKATQKGWDISSVQAALDAFIAAIPAAQSAHDLGAAIISSHNGFDASGNVTDRAKAITTVKALGQVLKSTRAAMDGTGLALRNALKALRDSHPSAQAPQTP